jgi:hypothetical protein
LILPPSAPGSMAGVMMGLPGNRITQGAFAFAGVEETCFKSEASAVHGWTDPRVSPVQITPTVFNIGGDRRSCLLPAAGHEPVDSRTAHPCVFRRRLACAVQENGMCSSGSGSSVMRRSNAAASSEAGSRRYGSHPSRRSCGIDCLKGQPAPFSSDHALRCIGETTPSVRIGSRVSARCRHRRLNSSPRTDACAGSSARFRSSHGSSRRS